MKRSKFIKNSNNQRGDTAILTTVLIMAAVLSLALILTATITRNLRSTFELKDSVKAFYAADAAAEKCVYQARKSAGSCVNVGGTVTVSFSNGASAEAGRTTLTTIESLGSLRSTNRKIRVEGNFGGIVVSAISPSSGVIDSVVSGITVTGSGFEDEATVLLRREGYADVLPSVDFTFVDTTTLNNGAFDLTGVPLGDWDVVARNPGGQSGTLAAGFAVEETPAVDEDTKLLIQSETYNGSAIFTDSSPSAHVVTSNYSTTHSTNQAKFGSSSLYSPVQLSWISFSDHNDWNFGSGDFTIDFWIYPTEMGAWDGIAFQGWNGDDIYSYPFWMLYFSQTNLGRLRFYTYWNPTITFESTSVVPTNTWTHVALVRSGATLMWFINGNLSGTQNIGNANIRNVQSPLYVAYGRNLSVHDPESFIGYLEEFRISKGVARWTSNFTPPTAPY